MTIHHIQLHQEFDAPIDTVWSAFSDHASFGRIMGQQMTRIVDSTDPTDVNGVGSTRLLGPAIMPFHETIMRSERPTVIEYQITKGTPLHHHYGRMHFTSLPGDRTALDYHIELGSRIPLLGSIVRSALDRAIASGLRSYARKVQKGQ